MFLPNFSKFLTLLILFAVFQRPVFAIKKSYIVYLGEHSHGTEVTSDQLDRVTDSHHELLGTVLGSREKVKDSIFYSYDKNINGFAAMLEVEEAAQLARHLDVVSVLPNRGRNLHTTHSWEFLMLEKNGEIHPSSIWKKARFGEDTIIANLDTGVWPEARSFSEDGYGPIPSRWQGTCQQDGEFTCNKKLIGARYYNKGYLAYGGEVNSSMNTARDYNGHGSHTLSTAGGNFVPGASVFGVGNGTAKGGSPKARVATYKVCFPPINGSECFDADIMKAFDRGIADGVDVFSISLGGQPVDYFDDGMAIASFHAVRNGKVVVASAGNSGPTAGTVSNVAPWYLTVGASSIDRSFRADVKLENGPYLKGTSLSKAMPQDKFYPLIDSRDARAADASPADALLCMPGSLDPEKVKGKILVCLRGKNPRMDKGNQAARAGALGMILCNNKLGGNEVFADPHVLPATQLNYTGGLALYTYLNSTKNPLGLLMPPVGAVNMMPAPVMAPFSSRGPNTITPGILKPDVTAPGINIIAAYSEGKHTSEFEFDTRTSPFFIESGTSMACPHVSGVAGLLKTLHPDWSPSAIRSAIMTTARTRDNTKNPMKKSDLEEATPLDHGTGHIRPNRAMDPGLVYDLSPNDYLDFLCAIGYNQTKLKSFTQSKVPYDCPKKYSLHNFNYPSIAVPHIKKSVTVHRKLKNVGTPGTYAARLRSPPGYSMSIEPKILKFDKIGEEKSFKLHITTKFSSKKKSGILNLENEFVFGALHWTDGKHYVRCPVAVPPNH